MSKQPVQDQYGFFGGSQQTQSKQGGAQIYNPTQQQQQVIPPPTGSTGYYNPNLTSPQSGPTSPMVPLGYNPTGIPSPTTVQQYGAPYQTTSPTNYQQQQRSTVPLNYPQQNQLFGTVSQQSGANTPPTLYQPSNQTVTPPPPQHQTFIGQMNSGTYDPNQIPTTQPPPTMDQLNNRPVLDTNVSRVQGSGGASTPVGYGTTVHANSPYPPPPTQQQSIFAFNVQQQTQTSPPPTQQQLQYTQGTQYVPPIGTDFEGGGQFTQQPYNYMAQQGIESQMSKLSLDGQQSQQTTQYQHVTTGQIDTLPRPTLYHFLQQKQVPQPDVTPLFARHMRNPEFQNIPFSRAQSSSRFMRSSLHCLPNAPSLAKKWTLPLGVILHPMAEQSFEGEIPVIHMGNAGIVRCFQCKTYINPFVSFLEYGKKWQCNMCKYVNDVPKAYYSPLDEAGVRRDMMHRKELIYGSVEFIAPQEYMARVPQPPAYLFVMDVSYNAIQSGMFVAAARAILQSLDKMIQSGGGRTQIGFITFDSSIHFYNLKSTLTQPQMLVVGELNESLLPLPTDLLVNLEESKQVVTALLNRFTTGMFSNTTNVESALGAALNAAGRVLGRIGGKLSVMLANLPTLGPNALTNREDHSLYGGDNETKLLQPVDNRFKEFALLYSRDHICCDLYLMSVGSGSSQLPPSPYQQQAQQSNLDANLMQSGLGGQYLDVASLSCLSKFTGGQCNYYTVSFSGSADSGTCQQLQRDLARSLTRETGFEAVMRIRCSSGLEISNFYGNFFIRGHDLLALPNIDSDKAFAVELQHSGSFISTPNACMQCAVLYTSSEGERRIRVHNICLPITQNLADLYKHADLDATINLMARLVCDQAPKKGLQAMRNKVRDDVVNSLRAYRDLIKTQQIQPGMGGYVQQGSQLVLPDSLRLLPLFAGALAKHECMLGGKEIRADERTYWFHKITTSSVFETSCHIHPLLFACNEIPEDAWISLEKEEDEESRPKQIDPSKVQLAPLSRKLVDTENGVYLLCDDYSVFVWLAKRPITEAQVAQDISNVIKILNEANSEENGSQISTTAGRNLYNIVQYLREAYGNRMPVRYVNDHPSLYQRIFVRKLIEDKTIPSTMGYDEFLVHVHGAISKY
jgi:protein transport protein SEC24